LKFNLKKKIRDEFRAVVPNKPPKLYWEELLPKSTRRTIGFSLQRVIAVMALFVVVLLTAVFKGWIPTQQTTTTNNTITTGENLLQVDETTLANPLITATNLSFSMGYGGITKLAFRLSNPVFMVDTHLDWIHRYVGALETAFSENGGYKAVPLNSDREGYEHFLRSTAPTLSGIDKVFDLYYNIDSINEEASEISGIVVIEEDVFDFTGKLEIQENETKWTIRSYDSSDVSNTYVETEMVVESEEQTIETRIVENGVLIHESIIKLEFENDEAKIIVETKLSDESIVFEIKWEEDDLKSKLKGTYAIDGINQDEQGEFTIELYENLSDQTVYYRYTITSNEQTKVVDKNRIISNPKEDPFGSLL
jgi:hypothetical protein